MRKGLIVGINYEGTGSALRGCINDARNIERLLQEHKFDDIRLVLEGAATTEGIKNALEWLVQGAAPGDILVFHYSGHGSQLPSRTEADGWEEIICPIDINWRDRVITDADLKRIFSRVPLGVNTTIILDCCHSGDGLNQNEAYIPHPTRGAAQEADAGERRFLPPPADVAAEIQERDMVHWRAERDVNRGAMLIATSQSHQTSADAFIDGTYQGAGTAALLKAVATNSTITYKQLIEEMNEYMISNRFSQRPQLDGSFSLHDREFLSSFGDLHNGAFSPVDIPAPVAPPAADPAKKKDDVTVIIAIVVLFILAMAIFGS